MRLLTSSLILTIAVAFGCTKSSPNPDPKPEDAPQEQPAADAAAKVKGEEIVYEGGGAKMKGYLAYDENQEGKRPGVIVVHEWWGHNDYARKRADMLAEMGFTAFALDMYGDGKQAGHPDDAKKFMMEVLGNMESAKARFTAAVDILKSHDTTAPEQVSAIGYCFGGGVVLHMARFGAELDGVASFHGSLGTETPAKQGEVKAKILVLHGAADPFVPEEQVAAFKKEMAAAGADMKFVAYPGAQHAFTNPAASENGKKFELPLAYDESADQKSWAELEAFLGELYPKG